MPRPAAHFGAESFVTAILSSKHLYEAADAAAAISRVELLVQAGASL